MSRRKATAAELELRIEYVIELLAAGHRPGAIKAAIREKFGAVSARQIFRYMARARAEMLEAAGASLEQLVAESLAFYRSITADEKARVADKLRARERIDQLLGLEKPRRLEFGGTQSAPSLMLSEDEALERIFGPDEAQPFPPPATSPADGRSNINGDDNR